jgi:Putative prokaryotic signal transducing protein
MRCASLEPTTSSTTKASGASSSAPMMPCWSRRVGALLDAAHIPHVVLDQNMSVLEGSIGILPRRILVNEYYVDDARELLEEAGPNNNYETPCMIASL